MKMSILFFLIICFFQSITGQNDPPVAVNDTASTINQVSVAISVLDNDYDPEGHDFEINRVRNPRHGNADYIDDTVYYTSEYYVGVDSFQYRISEVDNSSNRSEYAWVFVNVGENPNLPVAVEDEYTVDHMVPTQLFIMDNDYHPQGKEMVIDGHWKMHGQFELEYSDDSSHVLFRSEYPFEPTAAFEYRLRERNTEDGNYFSEWKEVAVNILANPNIPSAVDDHVEAVGGVYIDIPVLDNDISPEGLALKVSNFNDPLNCQVELLPNSILRFTGDYSFSGIIEFGYTIQVESKPYLEDLGKVIVNVDKNPNRPIAVDDNLPGTICGDIMYFDVLENDYHPDGKEIVIKSIRPTWNTFTKAEIVDNLIKYSHPHFPVNMEMDTLYYRVMEKDNPESYSEEARVIIDLQLNPEIPEAKSDKFNLFAGYPSTLDVLANDDMKGFEVKDMGMTLDRHLGTYYTKDLKIAYSPFMTSDRTAKGGYTISDFETYLAIGNIEIDITGNNSYDSLMINNINAGVHSDGFLFSKYNETLDGSKSPEDYQPHFEYPAGSGKHTIFSTALWIGGKDDNDSLHLAAQRYKQVGYDYQFGPVSDDYNSKDYFVKWSRLWKVSKTEVSYHMNNYWKDDYEPVEVIVNWPGNGEVELGQSSILAPFFDKDEDGIYEPMSGDYPLIRGDQSIFFIYNDDRIHTETDGAAMKVEIHGMAYAYDMPGDTSLQNTIFLHLDLYNRSEKTYTETYLGYYTDIDLGYAWDDYVGSTVKWGSFYGYNGMYHDGNGEPGTYGSMPPAQSITVLAGPFMDADNNDNPANQCDYSINGLNFGDGTIDNERMGMTRFVRYGNGATPWGDPQISPEYYTYMLGLWRDGSPILYGADGIPPFAEGPACRFMFPGDSDTCNWGTDGQLPNGGYNQNGKYWTESEVQNPPGDRRGLGVSGPFTFKPGDIQEVELAYCVGQGEDVDGSIEQLFDNLEDLFIRVRKGEIIVPNEILDVEEKPGRSADLEFFPNPGSDRIYVRAPVGLINETIDYDLYNSTGVKIHSERIVPGNTFQLSIKNLKKGFYILVIEHKGVRYHGKFMKM